MKNRIINLAAKKAVEKDLCEISSHQALTILDHRPPAGCQAEPASRTRRTARTSARLTAAENRVLTHLSRAKTNKEIASALGISPATVKRHLEKILTKLRLRNRVEAAIYGVMINGCPLQSRPSCIMRDVQGCVDVASDREPFDR